MKYLVSLPQNAVASFYRLSGKSESDWYCASDPPGRKVGSGGMTAWLLSKAWKNSQSGPGFFNWIAEERRIRS